LTRFSTPLDVVLLEPPRILHTPKVLQVDNERPPSPSRLQFPDTPIELRMYPASTAALKVSLPSDCSLIRTVPTRTRFPPVLLIFKMPFVPLSRSARLTVKRLVAVPRIVLTTVIALPEFTNAVAAGQSEGRTGVPITV